MNYNDIDLPPLPPLNIAPSVEPVDYPEVAQALMDYARAAIKADRLKREDHINDDRDLLRAEIVALKGTIADLEADRKRRGNPMAWVTADTVEGHTLNGKPRRIWLENNEGVGMPIYADPQPAEQQPDVEALVEALEDVGASWHGEGYMRNVARRALAAHRNMGGGE